MKEDRYMSQSHYITRAMFLNMFCLLNANFMGKRGTEIQGKIVKKRIKDSKEIKKYIDIIQCHYATVSLFLNMFCNEMQIYGKKRERGRGKDFRTENKRQQRNKEIDIIQCHYAQRPMFQNMFCL